MVLKKEEEVLVRPNAPIPAQAPGADKLPGQDGRETKSDVPGEGPGAGICL